MQRLPMIEPQQATGDAKTQLDRIPRRRAA